MHIYFKCDYSTNKNMSKISSKYIKIQQCFGFNKELGTSKLFQA